MFLYLQMNATGQVLHNVNHAHIRAYIHPSKCLHIRHAYVGKLVSHVSTNVQHCAPMH